MDLSLPRVEPAERCALTDAEIHLWSAGLEVGPDTLAAHRAVLSDDERERALRYRSQVHCSRFIAARGLLRTLLGAYLGAAPASLRFEYGAYGKPSLRGDPIHFNVSHSEARALYAFTWSTPVGVDLECVRPIDDLEGIVRRFFSSVEASAFAVTPLHGRADAFFRCWTRKEAVIKALGQGLSHPLDRFAVSLGDEARLLPVSGGCLEAAEWCLHHLEPAESYVGAIAVRSRALRLVRFDVVDSTATAAVGPR